MSGRLAIALIFGLALAMGAYGWWHNFQQGRKSLRFWGSDAAVMIRFAPEVQLLVLQDRADSGRASETLEIGNRQLAIAEQFDITRIPGLVHARHALVEDASFCWPAGDGTCEPRWQFALRFIRDDRQATVAFDPCCDRVMLVGRTGTAQVLAERMDAFDRKQLDWANAAGGSGGF